MPWKNSQLKIDSTAESGIELEIFWSVDDVTTETSGWTFIFIHFDNQVAILENRAYFFLNITENLQKS